MVCKKIRKGSIQWEKILATESILLRGWRESELAVPSGLCSGGILAIQW